MSTRDMTNSELTHRLIELEVRYDVLSTRVDETIRQTREHNGQLVVLSSKLDDIRNTLQDLKAMPQGFVPRQEMQIRMEATAAQMALLQEGLNTMHAAQVENSKNYVDLMKTVHANTIATYGTVITVVIGLVGLFMSHK